MPGIPLPLGANIVRDGTQFSIFSRNATSVSLALFHSSAADSPCDILELDPVENKTGDIWHIWVQGISEGQIYGYYIDGPYEPAYGHRFNPNKLLLDPYARAITDNFEWDLLISRGYNPDSPELDISFSRVDSTPFVPRSIVINSITDNTDRPLNLNVSDLVIYELHLKGYTCHESSGVTNPGTFRGLTEKIPYLKELGITAVELLPIQEFDQEDTIFRNPVTGEKLKNYWGYSTLAFFAPKGRYSASGATGEHVREFREMVAAFHDAGIEVILDVVFNHTGEGDEKGPTLSFRGIDNSIYYILEEKKRYYRNYSGCGNTFNCNHPLVRDFILNCLRYWVIEMKVDGFRFDLASILGRDEDGNILSNPPLIDKIEEDPILRNTKIIAEAWDAAGAYQVGSFPGRWAEWNGKFRDDVRKFWRGDPGSIGSFSTRVTGSSDLYHRTGRNPLRSINFITCHDGFTLNDLVCYNFKHNEANGEENRDGENNNYSYNWGMEGPSRTRYIESIRVRMIKNMIATLFLARGIPMLLAGDEFRRTQGGNNNSYCQDNEISWVDWGLLGRDREIYRFTREMIRFRRNHAILRLNSFFSGERKKSFPSPDISWHGFRINQPDWSENSRTIGLLVNGEYALEETFKRDNDLYIIFNSSMISRYYDLPPSPSGRSWKLALDTANPPPGDIYDKGLEASVQGGRYYVKKLSTVVLVSGD